MMPPPPEATAVAPHWPPLLQPGDLVAVVAPASPVEPEIFRRGRQVLEEWGFRLRHGEEIFQARPWGRDTDRLLAAELRRVMDDPEVRGVICARGGYGSLKLLEHLDNDPRAVPRKVFVGFSDVTNLLCHFYQREGLVTFHGPNVAHLGEATPAARASLLHALTASRPHRQNFTGLNVIHPGRGHGPLVGGNLTTLCHLVGTPFLPDTAGHILFLEDQGEAAYRIDRMLHHLRLAGVLDRVAGVVLGSFTNGGDLDKIGEIAAAALAPLKCPVLAGLPVGHQPDNHTLPLGALASLDAEAGCLEIVFSS